MNRQRHQPDRPHRRDDLEYVRAGRDGTYWQAADGLVVRLATAETAQPDARKLAPEQAAPALANDDAAAE